MILHTGLRTDIPAFYPEWLAKRIKAGFVLVRNPFNPNQITKYRISPEVVDVISFCTKNPAPFFSYLDLLEGYGQYWYVTITPYGKEIEPMVPEKERVLDSFCRLSEVVGKNAIGWRYDPIFISEKYTVEQHIKAFEHMAERLAGYTYTCVISFIDLYKKGETKFSGGAGGFKRRPVDSGKRICADWSPIWHCNQVLRRRHRVRNVWCGL